MDEARQIAVLLLTCPDRKGLVSRLSHFVYEREGNILDLDEHVDAEAGRFFIRVAWDMDGFTLGRDKLTAAITPLADEFQASWSIHFSDEVARVALLVSRQDHCLQEILWRHQLGEFAIDIPLIVSNHEDLAPLAAQHSIPFHHLPVTAQTKPAQEAKLQDLLVNARVDTVVLARYMQILSAAFVAGWQNRIINIHHSFLPAFAGSDPYRQAFQRGVKVIGATSHYVTADLDEGPIIEQEITRISHRDSVPDLKRKGRDLERLVLARALRLHTESRVIVCNGKTIVFD